MRADEFEAAQRAREWFHGLTIPPGMWVVLRADGRGFSRLTEKHYAKPFDERMRDHMTAAARAWMTEFAAVYGCTHSDEISVVLPPDTGLFGRGVEKLVSISAGICSAAFTTAAGLSAHFDARVWIGATAGEVADYFAWRHADAARCALSTSCYWAMRHAGSTPGQATAELAHASAAQQNELLYRHGINFNDLPAWQRRGVGLRWEDYAKTGLDPRTGAEATAIRRRLCIDEQLPVKDQYRAMVMAALDGPAPGAGGP
ncbi:MAG: tRNA 5'-guanylyltransferase [Actinobacteria bacterium]|nr:tRNA 5'-guanylyltransferase [Actinomycetota bacterium]